MKTKKRHIIESLFLSWFILCAFSPYYAAYALPEKETIARLPHQKSFCLASGMILSRLFSQDNEGFGRTPSIVKQKGAATGTSGVLTQPYDHNLTCSQANLSPFNSSPQRVYSFIWNPRQIGFLGIFSGFSPPVA
ncbi:MAG: hypothetical protein M0033_06235 [Nitrospiraceae bacterium]|nr:hypothetical protein [Nitrospiraceae bacterium]